jgi:hypothetical protein
VNDYDALRAFDHLALAQDFYQAFRELPRHIPPRSWPRYFTLCHAAELAFKAYLLHHGATRRELGARKVRHSLNSLLARATTKGLVLSAQARIDFGLLHQAHEEFWHRYPKEDWTTAVYTIDQFEGAVAELLNAVAIDLHGLPLTLASR